VTKHDNSGFSVLYFSLSLKSLLVETYFSSFFSMRGGSRNAIAKKRTPKDRVKIKMYATLSILKAPAYPVSNDSIPSSGIRYWVLGIGKTFSQSLVASPQPPIPPNLLQNVRELPSGGLICHPLSGTDPIRPVLRGRRPHQQIHLGRLSESRAKCDRRRITERNRRVQR
jgi:hypothetical protein